MTAPGPLVSTGVRVDEPTRGASFGSVGRAPRPGPAVPAGPGAGDRSLGSLRAGACRRSDPDRKSIRNQSILWLLEFRIFRRARESAGAPPSVPRPGLPPRQVAGATVLRVAVRLSACVSGFWWLWCTCPSVCLPACLPVYLSALLYACLPACLSVCSTVCLPACLSICLLACLSACLSVCLSACLPVYLSVGLFVCLSGAI